MDPVLFREAYKEINQHPCAYEKSILSGRLGCTESERFCLAEREGVHCTNFQGLKSCHDFLAELRQQTRFILKNTIDGSKLPHAKFVQIQVGGIKGVFRIQHPDTDFPIKVESIHQMLIQMRETYGEYKHFPYQVMVQEVADFMRTSKRSTRRRLRKEKDQKKT